jgi:hypothetical protein
VTSKALKRGEDPQIELGPLKIWIHHRQFPDLEDYWDGNWLVATAQAAADGAYVTVVGPFLHLGEFRQWLGELEQLHATLSGQAELPTMEPNLRVTLIAGTLGAITAEIEITPDHSAQEHHFSVQLDQSFLPQICSSIRGLLKTYPIVGEQP